MKKLSLILIIFIVLGQLIWLSVQYDSLSREKETAVHLRIPAEFGGGRLLQAETIQRSVQADDPFWGRSLWWGNEWQSILNGKIYEGEVKVLHEKTIVNSPNELANAFPTRPKPGDDVTGALELTPALLDDNVLVAGFFKQDDAGLWRLCRVEAQGSSEDVAREGEVRCWVKLSTEFEDYVVRTESGELMLHPVWELNLCVGKNDAISPAFDFDNFMDATYLAEWCKQNPQEKCSIDIALRSKHNILVTQAYIGDKTCNERLAALSADEKEKLMENSSFSNFGNSDEDDDDDQPTEQYKEPGDAPDTPAPAPAPSPDEPTTSAPADEEPTPEPSPEPTPEPQQEPAAQPQDAPADATA